MISILQGDQTSTIADAARQGIYPNDSIYLTYPAFVDMYNNVPQQIQLYYNYPKYIYDDGKYKWIVFKTEKDRDRYSRWFWESDCLPGYKYNPNNPRDTKPYISLEDNVL